MNNFKNVVIVGQGYVGLPLSIYAAKSGYKVLGFDIDKKKIQRLKEGITDSPEVKSLDLIDLQTNSMLEFTTTLSKFDEPVIFVIAVPTPLNNNRMPDLTMLEHACELISQVVSGGSLIINESTSFIGTLAQLIKPIIENNSNSSNLSYAVAPERIDPGNKNWDLKTTPRIVAGINETSTRKAVEFYSKFCSTIEVVSMPEVAEAAKLFENTFRQVNIALVNQFSEIASKFNFSTHEALNAASTKPYGFMKFNPSIGVGGHCIPIDPSYLIYSAKNVGVESSIVDIANEINLNAHKNVLKRIRPILGGSVKDKKIQIVGIAYKPDISDVRESPALDLISELRNGGAKVSWHDPIVQSYNGEVSDPLSVEIDLGLIVTPHSKIDLTLWKKSELKVLDLSPNSLEFGWPKFL